jgi:hypothetical protein
MFEKVRDQNFGHIGWMIRLMQHFQCHEAQRSGFSKSVQNNTMQLEIYDLIAELKDVTIFTHVKYSIIYFKDLHSGKGQVVHQTKKNI